ncbi:MAG: nuclear transport factor 2 family protein [Sphingobacteriales bacterium]|nr:MAG: nuclear transport factor 2 family protein [Sphingobacteriales bacterium]
MKKYIITIALLTFGFITLAQNTFTQATFRELLDEYKKDNKAFLMDRLAEDFRYSNPKGKFLQKKDVIPTETAKITATDLLEPLVIQSGDLAVVSGIHKTTRVGADGKDVTSEIACTYTFQRRKGKWMFVASQQTNLVE